MNTAHPAARAAHPFLELTDRPMNMLFSRLVFPDGGHPADPLITRKGCQTLPDCQRRTIGRESVSQVRGHFMYDTV